METVKITSCVVKTQGTSQASGKPYTIYSVVLEDGRTGQSFEELKDECQIEIESKDYKGTAQLTFKKVKEGGNGKYSGGKGFYKPNPKEKALAFAIDSIKLSPEIKATSDQIIALAEKYNEWLNK